MTTRLSIAEIINGAAKLKEDDAKVAFLQQHNSLPLRDILVLTYSKGILEFDLPETAPPYKESDIPESQGMLYREARKLQYFVKGFSGENLHAYRKERLFIQMLETVDKEDAKILCNMIAQKPIKGLSKAVLVKAFGEIFPVKAEKQEG